MVEQRSDDVGPCIAVRDHHALGPGGRSARVVDRDQIALGNRRRREFRRRPGELSLVVEPALPRTVETDAVLEARQAFVDLLQEHGGFGVRADDPRAAVVQDVRHVVGRQPVVDRNERRPDLRHRVVLLEVPVRVVRDRRHAIAGPDTQPLQRRGPPVAALQEFAIGEATSAVDDGLPIRVQPAGAAREFQRRERDFQIPSDSIPMLSPGAGVRLRRESSPRAGPPDSRGSPA
jgi:hypothetical protein